MGLDVARPGPWLRAPFCVALGLVVVACGSPREAFRAAERQHRLELAGRYPVGSVWSVPTDAFGEWLRWQVAEPAPDALSVRALVEVLANSPVAPTHCWHGGVPRSTWGSSFGSCGIWSDYVFVDGDGRVLAAYRRFVD